MSEPLENSIAPAAYRFLDPSDDEASGNDPFRPFSVEFYYSIDDSIYIAEAARKTYRLPFRARYALLAFLIVNMVSLPATLWFFDQFFLGFLVFVFNFAMGYLFIPAVLRTDYRRYYQTLYGHLENEVVRIELDENGISCSLSGDTSFHSWKNVKRIEETKDSIYLFISNHQAISVRKSGFAYDNQKNTFLRFAHQQIRKLVSNG